MSFEALSLIEKDHPIYQASFLYKKKIFQAPSKVDPNKKQARSSNDKDGEHLFFIDRMANTVSGPSQAPIHLAEMSP